MVAKIKVFLSVVWADMADTWKRVKIYVLGLLALAIYVEWQKIKEALLAYSGKKEIKTDKKEDQALTGQEKADSDSADQLVKDADALPLKDETVTEEWYTKRD